MINSRFSIQIHILSLLAINKEPLTSERIAGSINCNPVLVRKELGILKNEGFVHTVEGKNGGSLLLVPAQQITLDKVYKIVFEDQQLFGKNKNEPNPACVVGQNINHMMDEINQNAEMALLDNLKTLSVQDLINRF